MRIPTWARSPIVTGLLAPAFLIACSGDEAAEPPPAHIENPTTESALTTVHLTAQAEERIGIQLTAVEHRTVAVRRTFGGELVSPSGAAVTVTAPKAATVLVPEGGRFPVAGDKVSRGQELLRLAVLPPDLARAREDAAVAEARAANARAKAERARRLLDEGIASRADVEDAQAQLSGATAVADAARARLELMSTGLTEGDPDALSPVILQAAEGGVVLSVHVTPGQSVSDGAVLVEVVKADPL